MQFTDTVQWGGMDFLVAGILIFGASFTIGYLTKKLKHSRWRTTIIFGVLLLLVLLWAELAVGIFGTPFAGN